MESEPTDAGGIIDSKNHKDDGEDVLFSGSRKFQEKTNATFDMFLGKLEVKRSIYDLAHGKVIVPGKFTEEVAQFGRCTAILAEIHIALLARMFSLRNSFALHRFVSNAQVIGTASSCSRQLRTFSVVPQHSLRSQYLASSECWGIPSCAFDASPSFGNFL